MSKKVLIAEKSPAVGKIFKLMLEKLGLEDMIVVEDGNEGVRYAKMTAFDLVVAAHELPGFPGESVVAAARSRNPKVKAIITTTTPFMAEIEKLKRMAASVLQKPIDLKTFEVTLKALNVLP